MSQVLHSMPSPYRGLEPYGEEDSLLFFGRSQLQSIVCENLQAWRLTVLHGPSGVGKSSLLRAGVAEAIRSVARTNIDHLGYAEVAVSVFDNWRVQPGPGALWDAIIDRAFEDVRRITGGEHPPTPRGGTPQDRLEHLTWHLGCASPDASVNEGVRPRGRPGYSADSNSMVATPTRESSENHQREADGVGAPGGQRAQRLSGTDRTQTHQPGLLLVILDQFEDYISIPNIDIEQDDFLLGLSEIVRSNKLRVHFLISVQDAFLHSLARLQYRIPDIFGHLLRLQALSGDDATFAVECPMQVWNSISRIWTELYRNRLVIISGATGVGKSAFVEQLQQYLAAATRLQEDGAFDVAKSDWRRWTSKDPGKEVLACLTGLAESLGARSGSHPDLLSAWVGSDWNIWKAGANRRLLLLLDDFDRSLVASNGSDVADGFLEDLARAIASIQALRCEIVVMVVVREGDRVTLVNMLNRQNVEIPRIYFEVNKWQPQPSRSWTPVAERSFEDAASVQPMTPESSSVRLENQLARRVVDTLCDIQGRNTGSAQSPSHMAEQYLETAYLQVVMSKLWDEQMKRAKQSDCEDEIVLTWDTLNGLAAASEYFSGDGIAEKIEGRSDRDVVKGVLSTWFRDKMASLDGAQQKLVALAFRFFVTASGDKLAWSLEDLSSSLEDDRPLLAVEDQKLLLADKGLLGNALEKLVHERILRHLEPQAPTRGIRYELFSTALSQAVLEWKARFDHLRYRRLRHLSNVALARSLAADAIVLAEKRRFLKQDEKAALLAMQSYFFDARSGLQSRAQVDAAVRSVLAIKNFSIRLLAQDGKIQSVAGSECGRWVACVSEAGNLHIWDLQWRRGSIGHQRSTISCGLPKGGPLAFRQCGEDSSELLIGGPGDRVHCVDLERLADTGRIELLAVAWCRPLDAEITAIGVSNNGRYLACGCRARQGSQERSVAIWDLKAGTLPSPLIRPLVGEMTDVSTVAVESYSSGSGWIIAGCRDNNPEHVLYLWRLSSDEAAAPERPGQRNEDWFKTVHVEAACFHPDKEVIATCGADGRVAFWNPLNFKYPFYLISESSTGGKPRSLAWHPQGDRITVAYDDNRLLVYEVKLSGRDFAKEGLDAPGREDTSVASVELFGHRESVRSVACLGKGAWLVSGSDDGEVRRWDMVTPNEYVGHWPAYGCQRIAVIERDGQILIAGGMRSTNSSEVKVWKHSDEEVPHTVITGDIKLRCLGLSGNGQWLAIGADDEPRIYLWEIAWEHGPRTRRVDSLDVTGLTNRVEAIAFSRDSKRLACSCRDGVMVIWHLDNGAFTRHLHKHDVWVSSVTFDSIDPARLAFGDREGRIYWWRYGDDPELAGDLISVIKVSTGPAPQEVPENGVSAVEFTNDGTRLASAHRNRQVFLWPIDRGRMTLGEPTLFNGREGVITALAFSPDDDYLVGGGKDGVVRVWLLFNPQSLPVALPGSEGRIHHDSVNSVAFVGEGETYRLFSCSNDSEIFVWEQPTNKLIPELARKVKRNLSRDSWESYVGISECDYERTCGDLDSGVNAPEDAPAARDVGQVQVLRR